MNKITHAVLKHKKTVIGIFLALAILGAIGSGLVAVNYNMVDYLPEGSQSTEAIHIFEEEFGGEMPNARVMVSGVSIPQALEYKEKLEEIAGISSVTWLDDIVGKDVLSATPQDFLDKNILENYYREDSALYSVSIKSGTEKETVAAIYALIGEDNAASGNAVNMSAAMNMSSSEVLKAMLILVPVIIIILLLTTESWAEPILFLCAIGIAVLINMGTNVLFGDISFITRTVSPVLQLAVSLDYAIFLLHSFRDYRQEYEPTEAMARAMKKSLSAIAASAATTVLGFLALLFMRFGIGSDLGINLVKGVILSFISVMVFLPALTLAGYKLIDKTRHRSFLPDFKGVGKWIMKLRVPALILAVLIVLPCFLAQSKTDFQYGIGSVATASRAEMDELKIEERFGKENLLVLLVPRGDVAREVELDGQLREISHVTSVISYPSAVSADIPAVYLSDEVTEQFYSENYARFILYTDMADEGEETFSTVKAILDTTKEYYTSSYLTGQSATLYDMKDVVSSDTGTVTLAAILGIFLVLLFTFRSLSLPPILIFTIETAIWINLSFGYFSGQSFSFIGYLIVSTVQLGATVDYAILLTDRYIHKRKSKPKKEAMRAALGETLPALLTSGTILATAGFILAMTSTNPVISELGTLLGRGTLLSLAMVVFVLPALLVLLDKPIQKTTLRSGFAKELTSKKPKAAARK